MREEVRLLMRFGSERSSAAQPRRWRENLLGSCFLEGVCTDSPLQGVIARFVKLRAVETIAHSYHFLSRRQEVAEERLRSRNIQG